MSEETKGRESIIVDAEHEAKHEGLAAETHKNVNRIMEIEEQQRQELTLGEKISGAIAKFCGSMYFVYLHLVWFGTWLIVNTKTSYQFDPYPFTFLTLVVSLEAIFLSTFILISQNQEGRLTERRNQLDLQINMLAEQENTKILEILAQIAKEVGVSVTNDPSVKLYQEDMQPDKLVEQILNANGETKDCPPETEEES